MDRAALDAALRHGIACGGWCPAGRLDEVGRIPERYPIREVAEGSFAERTWQNVKDSDGTAIIYSEELRGGTKQTLKFCRDLGRPYELIDAAKVPAEAGTELIRQFLEQKEICTLNIAGPRLSEWPEGYEYTLAMLGSLLVKWRLSR